MSAASFEVHLFSNQVGEVNNSLGCVKKNHFSLGDLKSSFEGVQKKLLPDDLSGTKP